MMLSVACATRPTQAAPATRAPEVAARKAPCRGDARTTGFDHGLGVWDVRPHGAPANAPVSENRITIEQDGYRRQPDGSVRQIVERSTDGGATWSTAIDLHHVRRR